MKKELTKRKTFTIYPKTEKLIKELGAKYNLSDSRIIDLAVNKFLEIENNGV